MIIRTRTLLTMAGPPIENGAVCVRDGRIAAVGRWPEIGSGWSGEVLDLGEQVLLPGLINAHCHLDYTGLRGAIPRQESFTGWIRSINERKAQLTLDDYLQAIRDGFREAAAFGTTSLLNLEAFPELVARVGDQPLRTWWFAETIDVRGSAAISDDLPIAPHAPFTASRELYQRAAQQPLATTHLAESREELQMFRNAAAPLYEFMRSIGRNMDDCGGTTPLQLLLNQQLLHDRWIVAHLNELTADDFQLLEIAPRFHVVHCPRSHAYFDHSPFAMQRLRQLGFNVCIATDSLASSDSLSLLAELRQAQRVFPFLTARELLAMVTINPASALNEESQLGRLAVNYCADMIALPFSGSTNQVEETIVAWEAAVPWRVVNGRS